MALALCPMTLLTITLLSIANGLIQGNSSTTYRAAVFEYTPTFKLADNLKTYWYTAQSAVLNGAQIIVFPECGLAMFSSRKRSHLRSIFPAYSTLKIGSNPCNDKVFITSQTETFVGLSCMAKTHGIVIVANYGSEDRCDRSSDLECPTDGFYLFNTNFVFENDGTLLAVQRKYHTFSEPYFDRPKGPDEITFQTSFGAKFGIISCFDIIFESSIELVRKYNVSNIVYPTYWFDGYPFYVSLEVQERFARTMDVNFLAANIHFPNIGAVGSGIYSGKYGHVDYTYNTGKASQVLYADLPLNKPLMAPKVEAQKAKILSYHRMFARDFTGFTFKKLAKTSGEVTLVNNGLSCHLAYKYAAMSKDEMPFFGAFNGSVHTNNKKHYWGVEMCFLIYCKDSSCSKVSQSSSHK